MKLMALIAAVFLAGCHVWRDDITVGGISFEKARRENGLVIGLLERDETIAGRPCRRGWVQLHSNGVPAAFSAAKPIELPRVSIPPETWVIQNPSGEVKICAFPRDMMIQGHLCRGGAGRAKGVQTAFYPSGALKQYFLRKNALIEGIPCKAGLLRQSIELHENGRLKACVLSQDFSREGRDYKKGTRIEFDAAGRLLDGFR